MTVRLVPIQYDIKTSRAHLKRVRDLIAYPPTLRYLESETLLDVVDNQQLDNHENSHEESTKNKVTDKIDVDIDNSVASLVNKKSHDVKECNKTEKIIFKGVCVDVKEVMKEVSVHNEGVKDVKRVVESRGVLRAEAPVWMPISGKSTETVEVIPTIVTGSIDEEKAPIHDDIKEPLTEVKTGESTIVVEVQEGEIGVKGTRGSLIQLAAETAAIKDDLEVLNVNKESVDAKLTHATVSTPNVSVVRAPLPTIKEIFSKPQLGSFFTESLLNTVSPCPPTTKSLSQCVKSASLSGWNPPPPTRRIQGDLLYIEVVTEEV